MFGVGVARIWVLSHQPSFSPLQQNLNQWLLFSLWTGTQLRQRLHPSNVFDGPEAVDPYSFRYYLARARFPVKTRILEDGRAKSEHTRYNNK